MYASDDANGFFPVQDGWGAVGGQLPPTPDISGDASDYGGQVAQTNRPLNRYVPNVNTFHCPADKGDPLNPSAKTCWDGWGNSYLVEWDGDFDRVKSHLRRRWKLQLLLARQQADPDVRHRPAAGDQDYPGRLGLALQPRHDRRALDLAQ